LLRQSGTVAARASCRGPWGIQSALYVSLNPGTYFRRRLGTVSLVAENVLSLVAGALGARTISELSRTQTVDATLLRVRGYDADARSFLYALNPQFGSRQTQAGLLGGGSRFSLAISVPLAPEIQSQQLNRWLAGNGVGKGLQPEELARRFARNVPNLYDAVVDATDELALTAEQLQYATQQRVELGRQLADIWTDLAVQLVTSGERKSSGETLERVQVATDKAWEASRTRANRLVGMLTGVQESLLPWPANVLLRADKPVTFKIIYY
jgi:hypothetical protein